MTKPLDFVFVVRLSAIGDTLIAGRVLSQLRGAGLEPVLVTSDTNVDIVESFSSLIYSVFVSAGKNIVLMKRQTQTKLLPEPWENLLKTMHLNGLNFPILDLQNTMRSRRAIRSLQIKLPPPKNQVFKVPKFGFFRLGLILKSYAHFSQEPRKSKLHMSQIKSIHSIQKDWVEKILIKYFPHPIKNTQDPLIDFKAAPLKKLELDFFANKKYVAVFPGTSGPLKTWPPENFRECLSYILEKTSLEIVVCGGLSESEIGNTFLELNPQRVFNMAGVASLSQTFSLISNAQHVLTGDSFAAHAADLCGVSGTVVFGGTTPKFGFVPLSKNIEIVYQNLACSPCTRHGKGECRFHNLKCLKEISGLEIGRRIQNSLSHLKSHL